jgi:hypothetical protein
LFDFTRYATSLYLFSSLNGTSFKAPAEVPGKLSKSASACISTNMPGPLCFLPRPNGRGRDDGLVRHLPSGKSMSLGKPQAVVVVAVSGRVPVAVGGTHVPAVVDPGTAAQDTTGLAFPTITPNFKPQSAQTFANDCAAI